MHVWSSLLAVHLPSPIQRLLPAPADRMRLRHANQGQSPTTDSFSQKYKRHGWWSPGASGAKLSHRDKSGTKVTVSQSYWEVGTGREGKSLVCKGGSRSAGRHRERWQGGTERESGPPPTPGRGTAHNPERKNRLPILAPSFLIPTSTRPSQSPLPPCGGPLRLPRSRGLATTCPFSLR